MEDIVLVRCERGIDLNNIAKYVEHKGFSYFAKGEISTATAINLRNLETQRLSGTVRTEVTSNGLAPQGSELWTMIDNGRLIKINDASLLLEIDRDTSVTKSRHVLFQVMYLTFSNCLTFFRYSGYVTFAN